MNRRAIAAGSAAAKAMLLCAIGAGLFLTAMIIRDPVSARFYIRSMIHPATLTTLALAWAACTVWLLADHGGRGARRSWPADAVSILSGAVLIATGILVLFLTCVMVLMDPPDWLGYLGPKTGRIFIALLTAMTLLRVALALALALRMRPPRGFEA